MPYQASDKRQLIFQQNLWCAICAYIKEDVHDKLYREYMEALENGEDVSDFFDKRRMEVKG